MTLTSGDARGYRCVDGVFQYSCAVAALPGFEIVRVRFDVPVPIADGFARIEQWLRDAGRPLAAFCACELRSPEPFSEAGFRAFNASYVEPLRAWGLIDGERNPIARSNLCPAIDPPRVPSFFAFSYTRPSTQTRPTFVISGSAEAAEGGARYDIVRAGDVSLEGLREKVRFVLGVMEERLAALGFGWRDTTATNVYTVQNFFPLFGDEFISRDCGRTGLMWFAHRPPLAGLEYEMDTRAVMHEEVVA
jgi:hypothetical protein